ncbi:MAG TPA: hypothetical protein VI997_01185 [Candidatus Thermoplasmatota archaeon]|nr:hypothetical protein [Candidatus Thermoplasmatota archaeon]
MSPTPWEARLRREAREDRYADFDLLYHVSLAPVVPPEYDVPGIVALTFRLDPRPHGGHVYVTTIDPGAALRLGTRLGLEEAEAFALIDSHERIHIQLQLAGAAERDEERMARHVDAVWLSLRHPRAAERVAAGAFVVTRIHEDFWEAVMESPERPGATGPGGR